MNDWSRFLYPYRRRPSPRDRYAGYNDRVFASIIDAFCIFFVLGPPLFWLQDQFYTVETLQKAVPGNTLGVKEIKTLLGITAPSALMQVLLIGAVQIAVLYKFHTTPGRWLLGQKLVDAKTEQPPTLWQLIRRFLGYFISLPPLMLGYIWCSWDKKRQTWHDKIAGTVVLDTRPHGWYWQQVKRLYRKARGLPEPEAPPPPANDN